MSMATICEAIGAYKGHYFKKYFKDETTVFVMTALSALCFLIMVIPGKFFAIIGFGLFSFCAGVAFPVQKQLLNDHIDDSQYRASILSFESLGDRVVCSLASVLIGLAFKNQMTISMIIIGFSIISIPFFSH